MGCRLLLSLSAVLTIAMSPFDSAAADLVWKLETSGDTARVVVNAFAESPGDEAFPLQCVSVR